MSSLLEKEDVRLLKAKQWTPITELDKYAVSKILVPDTTKQNGYTTNYVAIPELYYINKDYVKESNTKKVFSFTFRI